MKRHPFIPDYYTLLLITMVLLASVLPEQGKFADALNGKLNKGQLVFVQAHASTNKGTDGKVYVTYFVDTLRICGGNGNGGSNATEEGDNFPF